MDRRATRTDRRASDAVDGDALVRMAADLVRIPSVNPALGREGTGESRVADYTETRLRTLGLEVVRLEATPGRPSVVGVLEGGGGPSVMFNAHYDTVGVEGMARPFAGEVDGERLYGRGAYDMKGALAACIAAVEAIAASGTAPPGDVLVAAVADEETGSHGMREVLESFRTDHAVVTEPSELGICTAHKGFVWLDVVAHGRAAHGSRPDLGLDANLRMAGALARLAPYAKALAGRAPHPLLGAPSVHVGTLAGGEGVSTYAARSTASIERRTVPGEEVDAVRAELIEALGAGVEATMSLARQPFAVDAASPIVRALEAARTTVMGGPGSHTGTGPWTDAALLAAAGVDTVVFGPAGSGAHALEEWVDVASLVTLARVLAEVPAALVR